MVGGVWGYQRDSLAEFLLHTPDLPSPPPGDLFGGQAAKSVGQSLRAFQPTIRELTQVSAELKSTLENEIGINEIR